MSEKTLAVKYRPTEWEDLIEQDYIKTILENQIKTNSIKNAYLFTGPAGCGKTTSARIFANMINDGQGSPIEIDAASNNGVEQIRSIIEDAKFKPINTKYKVYIMDECHMLSIGAWNAMLKLLEEPSNTTIFILCTTDPQKVPNTILSRVQRYDFQKISINGIADRLLYIATREEKFQIINRDALVYIAKLSNGGLRDAITMLDKVSSFTDEITIDSVANVLGTSNYDELYNLLISLIDDKTNTCIEIIENIYNKGKDLKLFIKQFIEFILDVEKYLLFDSYDYTQLPNNFDLSLFKQKDYDLILKILKEIIELSNNIKYEQNPKVLIEGKFLIVSRW